MQYVFRRAIALALIPFAAAVAQNSNNSSGAPGRASGASSDGEGKKALNLEDYGKWMRLGASNISGDGKWMTYTLTPNEGAGGTLHIKHIDSGNEITVPLAGGGGGGGRGGRGGAAAGGGGGTGPTFSDDSKWITYTVSNNAGGRGAGGRGAGGGGRGNA